MTMSFTSQPRPGPMSAVARGILFALDARSGAVLWQWDTTVDNLWGSARRNAGGGIWYPLSVDDAGNLYFGTGNPAPWPEMGVAPEESSLDPGRISIRARWSRSTPSPGRSAGMFRRGRTISSITTSSSPRSWPRCLSTAGRRRWRSGLARPAPWSPHTPRRVRLSGRRALATTMLMATAHSSRHLRPHR